LTPSITDDILKDSGLIKINHFFLGRAGPIPSRWGSAPNPGRRWWSKKIVMGKSLGVKNKD